MSLSKQGWSNGQYYRSKCDDCKNSFYGSKRSWRCYNCALKRSDGAPSLPKEAQLTPPAEDEARVEAISQALADLENYTSPDKFSSHLFKNAAEYVIAADPASAELAAARETIRDLQRFAQNDADVIEALTKTIANMDAEIGRLRPAGISFLDEAGPSVN